MKAGGRGFKAGISFCHHCNKQLTWARPGAFSFDEIKDPLGNAVRVHKQCKNAALAEGYKA